MNVRIIGVFLLEVFCFAGIKAKVANDSTSIDTVINLDDVIVKASRIDVKVRAIPGSIQYLPENRIHVVEASNLSGVINQVPGVYMQSGSFQTSRITIRGIGSRNPYGSGRIRAFLDDIPLSSGDGTTILEDIDPLFIDKIEIVKGPNSAWYGSGLGGAIRLYSISRVNEPSFQVYNSAGSFGTYKSGAIARIKKKNQINVGIFRAAADGYRQNSAFYRNSALISGQIGTRHQINYLFHVSNVKSFLPSSIDELTYELNPKAAAANWLRVKGCKKYTRLQGGITYNYHISDVITNKISISGGINNPYEVRPFNILDDKSKIITIQEQFRFSIGNNVLLFGGEWLHENYNWSILENNTLQEINRSAEKRNQANVYASWQRTFFSKLILTVSLNLNKTHYKIIDLFTDSIDYSGVSNTDIIISPRIGMNYLIHRNLSLYSSFGHGFSNPTVEESLNSQGFINPNLKPEQGWGFDLGTRAYMWNHHIWIDLNYYHISLDHLLVTKRIREDLFYGENAGSSIFDGVELLANVQLFNFLAFNASFQKSWNRFKKFISNDADYSGNSLPGIPAYMINSEIQIKHRKADFFVNYNQYGKQYLNDENTKAIKSWKTFDLKLIYNWQIKKLNLEFQAGVKNLFDEQYSSMVLVNAPTFGQSRPRYYYPGLPRNYSLAILLQF